MRASRMLLFRLFLAGVLAWVSVDVGAQPAAMPGAVVRDSQGVIVRNSNVGDPRIGNLCVRTGYWTPAQAIAECDEDLMPRFHTDGDPPPPRAPDPVPLAPRGGPADPHMQLAADVFFDFDKSVIKPAGKMALDDLLRKMRGMHVEVVIAVGHTDGVGGIAYNNRLSVRRAEAVKAYLVSHGVPANRIYVEGKGKSRPVADNRNAQGRAQNRRVEIGVVGMAAQIAAPK